MSNIVSTVQNIRSVILPCVGKFSVVLPLVILAMLATSSYGQVSVTAYDGVYTGPETLMPDSRGKSSHCGSTDENKSLQIRGGQVTYRYRERDLTGTVSADGSVSAAEPGHSGGVTLTGKVQSGVFTGETWSGAGCHFSLRLPRD